ncbi:hypothetical protein BK122_09560 [Paenibacillus pabuli]|nr:hypothetical protein BK122_09560 [Paenibacillus pabuli]
MSKKKLTNQDGKYQSSFKLEEQATQLKRKNQSGIFTPISQAVTDIVGYNANHFKIADQMRIKYPSNNLSLNSIAATDTVKRAMKGIEGISWDTLNPVEKAIRGGAFDEPYKNPGSTVTEQRIIEGRLNYQAANINFTNRLTELPQEDYSYSRLDNEDDESQLLLVSKKPNGSIIPVDEVRNAIGVMQLIGKITTEEMVAFTGHLQRFPMLGLEHKVGKLIRNSVKGLAKNVRLSGEFYRCRTRKSDEIMPWTEMEMWEAPSGISSQGRFNIEGNGFLYFSRDKEIAIMEMKQPSGTIIDIMNIKCEPKMDIKVIDITDLEVNLFKFCMFRAGDTRVKKEYLLPNFLSQCCQIENIHAIKYKSVFDHNTSNYVFFDYMRELFNYQTTMSIKTK